MAINADQMKKFIDFVFHSELTDFKPSDVEKERMLKFFPEGTTIESSAKTGLVNRISIKNTGLVGDLEILARFIMDDETIHAVWFGASILDQRFNIKDEFTAEKQAGVWVRNKSDIIDLMTHQALIV